MSRFSVEVRFTGIKYPHRTCNVIARFNFHYQLRNSGITTRGIRNSNRNIRNRSSVCDSRRPFISNTLIKDDK
jgi:hypothetical protein